MSPKCHWRASREKVGVDPHQDRHWMLIPVEIGECERMSNRTPQIVRAPFVGCWIRLGGGFGKKLAVTGLMTCCNVSDV